LEVREVIVIRAEPRRVFISAGIEDGEFVITTRLDAPIPGTLLTISGQESPSSGLDAKKNGVVASVGSEQ
jgi:hypothetical protein